MVDGQRVPGSRRHAFRAGEYASARADDEPSARKPPTTPISVPNLAGRDLGPRIGDGWSGVPAILERRGRGGRGQGDMSTRRAPSRGVAAGLDGWGTTVADLREWPSVPSEIPMLASRHDRRAPPRRDRAGDARLPERHLVSDGFDVLGADGAGEALEVAERSHPDPCCSRTLSPTRRRSRFAAGCARGSADGRGTVAPVIVLGRDGDDAVAVARRSTAAPTTCCCGRSPTTSCSRGSVRFCGAPPRTSATWSRQDRPDRPRNPPRHRARASRSASPPRSTPLLTLARDPRRVFTKEQLLRDVWNFRSTGRTRTVDSHASRVRRKPDGADAGPFVVNVWGWATGCSETDRVSRARRGARGDGVSGAAATRGRPRGRESPSRATASSTRRSR